MDRTYSELNNKISKLDLDLDIVSKITKDISQRSSIEIHIAAGLKIFIYLAIIFIILFDLSDGTAEIIQLFNPVEFYWTNYLIWLLVSLYTFAMYLSYSAKNSEFKRIKSNLSELRKLEDKNKNKTKKIIDLTPFLEDSTLKLISEVIKDSNPNNFTKTLLRKLFVEDDLNFAFEVLGLTKYSKQSIIQDLADDYSDENKLKNIIKIACIRSLNDHLTKEDLLLTILENELNIVDKKIISSIRKHRKYLDANEKIKFRLNNKETRIFPKINNSLTPIYAPVTEEFCREIQIANNDFELTIHWEKLREIIDILEEPHESILLVSNKGEGKSEVLNSLAALIEIGSADELKGKRLMRIDFNYLLRHLTSPENISDILQQIILEIKNAQNIILVIDEFDDLMSLPKKSQQILLETIATEIANENSPNQDIKLIMTIDRKSYENERLPNNMTKRFSRISLDEPSETAVSLLLSRKIKLYLKSRIDYNFETFKRIVELNKQVDSENYEPQKSLITLQKIIQFASERKLRFINVGVVNEYFNVVHNITINQHIKSSRKSAQWEYKEFQRLEEKFMQNLLGQPEVIRKLTINLLRKNNSKLLFYGPTGVGKKFAAELISQHFYGDAKLLKSCTARDFDETTLKDVISHVQKYPYSVLFFEEISEINKELLKFLDKIFKESEIELSMSSYVNFDNVTLIFSTKMTGDWINENFLDNDDSNYQRLAVATNNEITAQINSVIIENLDDIIMFRAINYPVAFEIVESELKKTSLRLENRGFHLNYDKAFINKFVEDYFYRERGAKKFSKAIDKLIDKQISQKLLENKLDSGGVIDLTANIN